MSHLNRTVIMRHLFSNKIHSLIRSSYYFGRYLHKHYCRDSIQRKITENVQNTVHKYFIGLLKYITVFVVYHKLKNEIIFCVNVVVIFYYLLALLVQH